jgi:hypothetical protein
MKKNQVKKFECECGSIIGLNQVRKHKYGKKHLNEMLIKKKLEKEFPNNYKIKENYYKIQDDYFPHTKKGLLYIESCVKCQSCKEMLCCDCDNFTINWKNTSNGGLKQTSLFCNSCINNNVNNCDDFSGDNFESIREVIEKYNKNNNDKWINIIERRNFYLKQTNGNQEFNKRKIQLKNISDKYLEWLID